MKQVLKTFGLLALLSVTAMAQAQSNVQYNPVDSMWAVEVIVYGLFSAVMAIALLYHSGQGALGSHDGWAKIVTVFKYAAIGYGGIYILTHIVSGSKAPI